MKFKFTDWSFLQREITAIENYLKKAHEQFKQTVLFEAGNYASKNFPAEQDESFEPCLATIRGHYNKLKKEVSIKLQGGVQKLLGAANLVTARENIECKEKEIQAESDRRDRLSVDRRRIFINGDHESFKKQRVMLLIFAIGECIWTISAFLKLGDIVLIALCLGIVIGLGQISAVKSAVQIIKEVADRRKQKIYTIVAIVGFLILSWLLALLRYWFIHKGAGADVPVIVMSPVTFVGINMLLIVATGLIVLFNYPSKEQIDNMRKAEKLDKEIQASETICKKLHLELDALIKEREFFVELRTRLIHAEKKLHEAIDMMFDEAVGWFKNENVSKRPDKKFPQSFKRSHKPLSDDNNEQTNLLKD